MACFGLKLGQDLGNRAAHPYRKFRGVGSQVGYRAKRKIARYGGEKERKGACGHSLIAAAL